MVKYLFKIQEKIVPEMITLAEVRYTILRTINFNQPVGRRTLAGLLDISERNVRNELKFLEEAGLITVTPAGAMIADSGMNFLGELDKYIKELKDINILEERLKRVMGLEEVLIVPVGLEHDSVEKEIGRQAADYLRELLKDGDILAVSGGFTLAQVANSMKTSDSSRNIIVVPGQGGIGEKVEIQANTIAAEIAKKLGADYRMLHIPDNIKKENLPVITSDPAVKQTLDYLKKANILIHGIGGAEDMALRRSMPRETIQHLLDLGAVGEAFGLYFNEKGEVVFATSSVGLGPEDLKEVGRVIVVAGGVNKARAIISVVSPDYHDMLITDELTARELLKLKGGEVKKDR